MNLPDLLRAKIQLILNWIAFLSCVFAFVGLYEAIYKLDFRLISLCAGTFLIALMTYKIVEKDED